MKKGYLLYFFLVFFVLYCPLAVLLVNGVNVNRYGFQWDGFTLQWYRAMLENDGLMEAALNSLIIGVSSASFATLLGGGGAVGIYFYRFRGRFLINTTILVLMMVPDIILAISMLVMFVVLEIPLGFLSLFIAHTTFCLPFVVITVASRLNGFDPFLIDAARDLGASDFQTIKKIIIPLVAPSFVAAWLLSFTLSLDDVIVSSFVTGPAFDVLPLKIFSMVKVGVKPEVNAMASIMIIVSILFIVMSQILLKENKNMNKSVFVFFFVLSMVVYSFCANAEEKLYIYNWTEYIPDQVLEQFTEETGIKVIYSTYESNEAMYAKLKLINAEGYDLVFPSTYFISKMVKEGLLQPLNHSLLPNMNDLDPALLDKEYDKGNTYSIPYMWGSTGIGVNRGILNDEPVTSWKDLWNPKFKGQILLQDDMREVFHMALKIKGYSTNTQDESQIKEAYELLRELMPNVLLFNSDSPRMPYLAGEVSLGMLWNGEAWMAYLEDSSIDYVYPSEGANFWVDSFAIPKNAKNVQNAHRFIDFMLRPEVAKICVEENGYATPVLKALPLLDEEIRNSPAVFPSPEIVEQGEFQTDVGDAILVYQKYWELLRSGH